MRHALALALLLLLAAPCLGQHAAPRQQWQPQTEDDPRLQQPVMMEIVGRATRTGLPLLSAQTGVSLSVAPEDLATVGERKFLLLAQGCSLKTIMVQLCAALQECHWDVDTSRDQPAYLLHRNGGMDYRTRPVGAAARERRRQYAREETLARMADARAALAAPASSGLEHTDLPLALALRDPITRSLMEAFLSLPQEQLDRLLAEGEVTIAWEEAPPALQQAARQTLERSCAWMLRSDAWWRRTHEDMEVLGLLKGEQVSLPLTFSNHSSWRPGVVLHVAGREFSLLPARHPSANDLRMFLEDAGLKGAVPEATLDGWDDSMLEAGWAEAERRRDREWVDPGVPALHRVLATEDPAPVPLSVLQQQVVLGTGLSLVSDFYAADDVHIAWADDTMPAWRLLYQAACVLGSPDYRIYEWRAAGDCLTFWHDDWAWLAAQEVPEPLLEQYREKLRTQGRLMLDDLAALAAALAPQPERGISLRLPKDLREAGGSALDPYGLSELALYESLTPAQRAAAEGDGLPFRKMTRGQRVQVQRLSELTFIPPLSAEQVQTTTFRVQHLPYEPSGVSRCDLYLLLGDSTEPHLATHVRLPQGKPAESP